MRPLLSLSAVNVLAACAIVTAAAPAAHAADNSICVSSYEQSQSLRKAGKLHEARQRALECARDVCPAVLSRDCERWATELEASMPTVIFDVRGTSGEELSQVTVSLDGQKLLDRLDGKAVEVEPGTHTFRFTPGDDSKGPSKDVTVVIREGEKYRKISSSFEEKSVASIAATGSSERPKVSLSRPVPAGVYVFGGIGVASLAAGTFFALRGLSQKKDLDSCKPSCNPDDVDALTRNYAIADIAFGVGIVSGVAALYLYLTRPHAEVPASTAGVSGLRASSFSVTPTQGGARATLGLRF